MSDGVRIRRAADAEQQPVETLGGSYVTETRGKQSAASAPSAAPRRRWSPMGLAALALGLAVPLVAREYYLYVMALVVIEATAIIGLSYIIWNTELVSVGHAAIQGIGAYGAAVAMNQWGLGFIPALLIGCVAAGVIGLIVAVASVRVKGPYFTVVTLGLAWSVPEVLLVFPEITGGYNGISVPETALWEGGHQALFYYCGLAVLAGAIFLVRRMDRSRVGRALLMVRENEIAARTLGISPARVKILAITFGNVLTGCSGVLLLYLVTTIAPSTFGFSQSVFFLTGSIVGGIASPIGGLVGALFTVLVPQALSDLSGLASIVMGALLFAVLLLAPNGITPEIVKLGRRFLGGRRGGGDAH